MPAELERRRQATSPPRSTGRRSPALVLRCEEGRGSFEQIALLLQTRILAPQRAELFEFGAGRHIDALATVSLGLATPIAHVCSDTPRLLASSFGVRPARNI